MVDAYWYLLSRQRRRDHRKQRRHEIWDRLRPSPGPEPSRDSADSSLSAAYGRQTGSSSTTGSPADALKHDSAAQLSEGFASADSSNSNTTDRTSTNVDSVANKPRPVSPASGTNKSNGDSSGNDMPDHSGEADDLSTAHRRADSQDSNA